MTFMIRESDTTGNMRDSFRRNWGYFVFPVAFVLVIIWIVGVLGLFLSELSRTAASMFSASVP